MSWMDEARRTLAGRYELAEVIGRGGMGAVYRAVDLVLGRAVAVKMLPGTLADQDPTSVARFEREARAAAALSHPAVVAVYDTGADETARFIVMELISGRSLEAILRDEGPLEPDRAAAIVARVADALAAAHAAGIVHRDVKPANVMIASDGSVKVLDFGIARAMDSTTLTQNASVVGTAAYMSPEQALGKPADERADIYSLGCVLYALLAGRPPFSGDGAAAILNQHANVAPRPLAAKNGRVAPGLNALVLQMLGKSPEERPQTAAEVRDRLTQPSSSPARVPRVTAVTERLGPTTATRPLPHVARRDRRRLILAGALSALALVIALVALASGGGSPRATTSTRHDTNASNGKTATTRSRTAAPTTTAASRPGTSTPTTTSSNAPQTVSGAAGALTALTTQDVQSGTIDQQAAQQISNTLSDILNSYELGHTTDIQHKFADLSQHVAMLQQHGDITSAAAPGLTQAIARLGNALASSPPPTTPAAGASPPAQPAQPPGDGGKPPGQPKHDKPKGH
jgi:eukaryotic-like serine/threonine-protein kinase